jgi:hypothetical protein
MSKFVWIIDDVDHIDMKIHLNIQTQNHINYNSSIKKMHFFSQVILLNLWAVC